MNFNDEKELYIIKMNRVLKKESTYFKTRMATSKIKQRSVNFNYILISFLSCPQNKGHTK